MSKTRELANRLREEAHDTNLYGDDLREAAAAIDTLLDAIEAGGMVEPRPAPLMNLDPLRTLRAWHAARRDPLRLNQHGAFVHSLNKYFPPDDQL